VIVFPADGSLRQSGSRRIAIVRPASDGTFSVKNLPGGAYRLAALTDVDETDAADPAFLASLDSASVPITITDGQVTRQDLRLK
jgi:hypothetical protein